jgi:DNA-3-methyladenine glycosylase
LKLSRDFYSRPALEVAHDLLGKVLVRRFNGRNLAGMIVETEAYVGPHDLACHASKGRTPRTDVMFGPAGFAYVYMIYGFHFCLNAVTDHDGFPSAVLIRDDAAIAWQSRARHRYRERAGQAVQGDEH